MKKNEDVVPVEVFAGTIWEAGFVKSLLENAEIDAFLKDEFVGTLAPWNAAPGRMGSVKVIVSSLDYNNARQIILDYQRSSQL